jgi:2-polyprenyl-3-methyl-5-hydroxy-6-metoxy-1,4-benzoquinol methylase
LTTNYEEQVRKFYSEIQFPGPYTYEDLLFYNSYSKNNFINLYVNAAKSDINILDIGCGTGVITNLIALQHSNCSIDAVDFCDSIDYAKRFSQQNHIKNIQYHKSNFFEFAPNKKYDLIISNGVLHHMPDYKSAIELLKTYLVPGGELVLGIYNNYGKLYKKFFNIRYINHLLYLDQEAAPFEVAFSSSQFLHYFNDFKVISIYPSVCNKMVDFLNLFNYNNGGLTIYHLKHDPRYS